MTDQDLPLDLPLSNDLIAEANAREMAALDEDYVALGRKLELEVLETAALTAIPTSAMRGQLR